MAQNDAKRSTKSEKDETKQDEADRYKQAAEDALQQLDWTMGYLHGIRKMEISKALAKNRSFIRKQLMHERDPGVPTQESTET
jgi:outer membrane translocation and assembly module TamA